MNLHNALSKSASRQNIDNSGWIHAMIIGLTTRWKCCYHRKSLVKRYFNFIGIQNGR